ncbi:hypothetical protein Bbelb_063150 [Branchiostoma belcheri]|nr:hypothetical protein Bbelb_063150 [Branchiostoma belcheri]
MAGQNRGRPLSCILFEEIEGPGSLKAFSSRRQKKSKRNVLDILVNPGTLFFVPTVIKRKSTSLLREDFHVIGASKTGILHQAFLRALLLTVTPDGTRAAVCRVCEESEATCDPVTRTCQSNCSRTKVCSADQNCLATMSESREGRWLLYTGCFGAAPSGPAPDPQCTADFLRGVYTCTCRGDDCNNLMVVGGKLPWPGETPSDIWQYDNTNEAAICEFQKFSSNVPNNPRNHELGAQLKLF